jgi:hypothetical protein
MGLHRSDYHGEWDNMGGIVKAVPLLSLAEAGKRAKPAPRKSARVAKKPTRAKTRKK